MKKQAIKYQGQLYTVLAVDTRDYHILEAKTYEECAEMDWHHQFYLSEKVLLMELDGEAEVVWLDDNGEFQCRFDRVTLPMQVAIRKQIEIVGGNK